MLGKLWKVSCWMKLWISWRGGFSSSDSHGQVAVSQLQQVDLLQDLLQDDRPNFDIHLLQQSVLLGFLEFLGIVVCLFR